MSSCFLLEEAEEEGKGWEKQRKNLLVDLCENSFEEDESCVVVAQQCILSCKRQMFSYPCQLTTHLLLLHLSLSPLLLLLFFSLLSTTVVQSCYSSSSTSSLTIFFLVTNPKHPSSSHLLLLQYHPPPPHALPALLDLITFFFFFFFRESRGREENDSS